MKILVKGWFDIYHSYSNVSYFLLKNLKIENIKIYIQQMPFYNQKWEAKYDNNLNLEIYNNHEVDLVLNMYFPYIFDKNIKVPQIIFFTTEMGCFNQQFWNLTSDELKTYIDNGRLILLTCSEKSAKPLKDMNLPVKIIKHGFDSQTFYPSDCNFRGLYDIRDDQKVFLNISSCTGNKNLQNLIIAFCEYVKDEDNKDNILILKGIDDLYSSNLLLSNMIKTYNLELNKDNFRFIFDSLSFNDLNILYNTADVYVSCGVNEGFDVPIVESKACSLKVLTHKESPNHFLADETFETTEELKNLMKNIDNIDKKELPISYSYSNISNEFYEFFKELL